MSKFIPLFFSMVTLASVIMNSTGQEEEEGQKEQVEEKECQQDNRLCTQDENCCNGSCVGKEGSVLMRCQPKSSDAK
ncbi:hypothetical protein KQX54_005003 [Cotesia glomerata]|uniref:Uncharacterized protein n=1 Tax=Cotesia glomerata TaxID=32391 RepID=A0AAV7IJN0_COTGL|nr:hypothetical protein KQX54_005003 [Cotesia glomerata]